ncbi:hypothetical protein D9M68_955600 [compost metagenome]
MFSPMAFRFQGIYLRKWRSYFAACLRGIGTSVGGGRKCKPGLKGMRLKRQSLAVKTLLLEKGQH